MRLCSLLLILTSICLIIPLMMSCSEDDDDDGESDPAGDDDTADDDDDSSDDDDTADDDDDDDTYETGTTDDPDGPLCREWELDPEDMDDPVAITCLMEKGEYAQQGQQAPAVIRVVDWNILRGFTVDDLITHFQGTPPLDDADIILIQEADRGCPRVSYRNITRELAEALDFDFVYGVEFIEIHQERCEHGNAILSRYPIVRQRLVRHTDFEKWYRDGGQPRLGGRMSIMADIDIGGDIYRFSSVHYASKVNRYFTARITQAEETIQMLEDTDRPIIWGGDLNTGLYWILSFEPAISTILEAGYNDALDHLLLDESWTVFDSMPVPPLRLDWLFHMGINASGGMVLHDPPFDTLSDHLGIYADFPLN